LRLHLDRMIVESDGKFSEADTQKPLDVLKSFNEKVADATIDLSKTYTNAFVEKVMDKTTN
ncbi:hypothetical protein ACC695_39660, partial [Rhizobium ruizarguesonis]